MEGPRSDGHAAAQRGQRCRLLADALLAPVADGLAAGTEEVPADQVAPEIRQMLAASLGPRRPHMAAAIAEGALGADAVRLLDEVLRRAQPLVPAGEVADVEHLLVGDACRMPLVELAEMAAEFLVYLGAPAPDPATAPLAEPAPEPEARADAVIVSGVEPADGMPFELGAGRVGAHAAQHALRGTPEPAGGQYEVEHRREPDLEPEGLKTVGSGTAASAPSGSAGVGTPPAPRATSACVGASVRHAVQPIPPRRRQPRHRSAPHPPATTAPTTQTFVAPAPPSGPGRHGRILPRFRSRAPPGADAPFRWSGSTSNIPVG